MAYGSKPSKMAKGKGVKVPYPGAKGKANPFAGAVNAAGKQKGKKGK